MRKDVAIGLSAAAIAFLLAAGVTFAQTTNYNYGGSSTQSQRTVSPSPTNTTPRTGVGGGTMPSGAPSTGFGWSK